MYILKSKFTPSIHNSQLTKKVSGTLQSSSFIVDKMPNRFICVFIVFVGMLCSGVAQQNPGPKKGPRKGVLVSISG